LIFCIVQAKNRKVKVVAISATLIEKPGIAPTCLGSPGHLPLFTQGRLRALRKARNIELRADTVIYAGYAPRPAH